MATVAVPQTLVSQTTEKVFGFRNKSIVLKTQVTKIFSYPQIIPDTGYELVAAGDADYGDLYVTRVYEKIEASFSIKNMELMNHYDTADYRKAFMNPGEVVFTDEADTAIFLTNTFFNRDTKIKRYGISFSESGFVLDTDESTTAESKLTEMLIMFFIPAFCAIFWFLMPYFTKGVNFFEKDENASPNRVRNTILLMASILTVFPSGLVFLSAISDPFTAISIVPWYERIALLFVRIVVAILSIWALNSFFKYLYERKKSKNLSPA